MRLRVCLVSSVLLVAAAGCAPATDHAATRWDRRPCRAGTGAPISERTLKRILATHGIRLYRDHVYCFGSNDVRVLSALSNAPIGLGSDEEEAVRVSEGLISCDVLASGIFGRRIERFVWRNDRAPTYIRVLNVDCSISSNTRADTDALERAIRRLPGTSAKPTTVPSSDAIHD